MSDSSTPNLVSMPICSILLGLDCYSRTLKIVDAVCPSILQNLECIRSTCSMKKCLGTTHVRRVNSDPIEVVLQYVSNAGLVAQENGVCS